jgi:hypothetical protein
VEKLTSAMHKSSWKNIFGGAFIFMASSGFAATNLVLAGGGTASSAKNFGAQPPVWLSYLIPGIFLVAGLIQLFYPRIAWSLKMFASRWEFADPVEPSGLWIFCARIGGLILIGLSVWFFIILRGGSLPFSK